MTKPIATLLANTAILLVECYERLYPDKVQKSDGAKKNQRALREFALEQELQDTAVELDRQAVALKQQATNPAPINMVLYCPACHTQHVDRPITDHEYTAVLHESSWWELGGDKPERWTNPPHRSHLCHDCGHIWRPADVPTNGVLFTQTRGTNDSLPPVIPMYKANPEPTPGIHLRTVPITPTRG